MKLKNYSDTGLLIIRLGIGILFIFHGYPKLIGGPEKWEKLGGSMSLVGIAFFPAFWGFMAAAAEAIGGLLVAIGFAFRPACALLVITMLVASLDHFDSGDGISGASHALEDGFVFLGLFFTGSGKYSLQKK